MSGLVLPVSGEPLKPALKISGENKRRFYFEAIRSHLLSLWKNKARLALHENTTLTTYNTDKN